MTTELDRLKESFFELSPDEREQLMREINQQLLCDTVDGYPVEVYLKIMWCEMEDRKRNPEQFINVWTRTPIEKKHIFFEWRRDQIRAVDISKTYVSTVKKLKEKLEKLDEVRKKVKGDSPDDINNEISRIEKVIESVKATGQAKTTIRLFIAKGKRKKTEFEKENSAEARLYRIESAISEYFALKSQINFLFLSIKGADHIIRDLSDFFLPKIANALYQHKITDDIKPINDFIVKELKAEGLSLIPNKTLLNEYFAQCMEEFPDTPPAEIERILSLHTTPNLQSSSIFNKLG